MASINRLVQLCNSLWQGLKDALAGPAAGCYHYHARRGHIPQRVEPPLPQSMPHSLPQSLPLCVIRRSALDSSGCLSPRWSVQPSPLMKSTARVCTVCYLRSHSSCLLPPSPTRLRSCATLHSHPQLDCAMTTSCNELAKHDASSRPLGLWNVSHFVSSRFVSRFSCVPLPRVACGTCVAADA